MIPWCNHYLPSAIFFLLHYPSSLSFLIIFLHYLSSLSFFIIFPQAPRLSSLSFLRPIIFLHYLSSGSLSFFVILRYFFLRLLVFLRYPSLLFPKRLSSRKFRDFFFSQKNVAKFSSTTVLFLSCSHDYIPVPYRRPPSISMITYVRIVDLPRRPPSISIVDLLLLFVASFPIHDVV
jgi:hypothetical protein